jgi:hypothetical protein
VNYDPNNKGVLFDNKPTKKDKTSVDPDDKRPDWTGSCLINNVDYNIAIWPKMAKKSGKFYFSLKFEPKGEGKLSRGGEPQQQATKQPQMSEANWDDPDMPF